MNNNTITKKSIFLPTQAKLSENTKKKQNKWKTPRKQSGRGRFFANGVRSPPRLLYYEFPLHLLLSRKKSRRKDNKKK